MENGDDDDAVADASLDAADATSTTVDAAADAAAPVDPRWVPVPGLPDGCVIERAEQPRGAVPLQWERCPDELQGCDVLSDPARGTARRFAAGGYYDGALGYFVIIEADPDGRGVKALANTSPEAYAAWRAPAFFGSGLCLANPLGIGASHDSFGIYTRGEGRPSEHRIYWAPREDIGGSVEPIAVLSTSVPADHLLASSSGAMASRLSSFVTFVDQGGVHSLDPGPGDGLGEQQGPFTLVGDDVFWHAFGDRVRVAHGSPEGATEVFLAEADGDIRGMRSDGIDLAWYFGHGVPDENGRYEHLELWTSPYSPDPKKLEPRLVRTIERAHGYQQAVIGGGHWVYSVPGASLYDYDLWVVDLSDGTRRHLTFPHGYSLAPVVAWRDGLLVEGARPPFPERVNRLFRLQIESIPIVP